MKMLEAVVIVVFSFTLQHCTEIVKPPETMNEAASKGLDSVKSVLTDSVPPVAQREPVAETLDPGVVLKVVSFAETLVGTPYLYASSDPARGFDCSGFITYVFNHFNIKVPRSSVDFTNVGREIPKEQARRGDLILFTGTDSAVRIVGHMGIVVENTDSLRFIHSSSGKANGVVVTPLNDYYMGRFEKVIRLHR